MINKAKQAKRLEDYQPGATKAEVLKALSRVAAATNGKEPSTAEKKLVKEAAKHIVRLNHGAFKELERY